MTQLALALTVTLLSSLRGALAYNANNKLVDYYDNMVIASTEDPLTDVYTSKLYTFPYVEDVSNQ